VIDLDTGETPYVDAVSYDEDLPAFQTLNGVIPMTDPGVSESDPHMWIEAVHILFQRLKDNQFPIEKIQAISVSGQQHGLVALDATGKLARPTSKLWNDVSTVRECQDLTDHLGGEEAMLAEVGNTQRPGYTAAKIFHMVRHEPNLYAQSQTLFLVHNYINWYLTGGVAAMEPGDASGLALWNPVGGSWSDRLVNHIDPALAEKLPSIGPSTEFIGTISFELAERFGFSPDCRIDAGSGDNMYSAVGTGNVVPGVVTVSLGTSGTAFTVMEKPFVDPSGEIALFCDSTGHYLPLVCVSNMANGYNAFLRKHNMSHQEFDACIEESSPGNNGRLIVPWFEGERTPDIPNAEPVYYGFKPDDMDLSAIARGLLEGHILNLYSGFRKLPVQPRVIHLTGGLAQSLSWVQGIADIFNCETVPVKGEGAALGAALHAAWIWERDQGKNPELTDLIDPFIQFEETKRSSPRQEYRLVYERQFNLYQALTSSLQGIGKQSPFEIKVVPD
jgi:xylulokinase